MQTKSRSIYSCARVAAGITQEAAAEALNLSVRALADYETEQRRPPSQTVAQMAALYRAPGLRLQHAREVDELGVIPESAEPQRIELLSIQLYTHLMDFAEKRRGQQLLAIAADGVIDETERPLLDEIVCELEAIGAALLAIKVGYGSEKKERLTAATVKRSVPGQAENHCKTSIQALSADCKPQFERGRA